MDAMLCGGEKVIYVMVWVNAPCRYSDIHHHSVQQPSTQYFQLGNKNLDLDGSQRKAKSGM